MLPAWRKSNPKEAHAASSRGGSASLKAQRDAGGDPLRGSAVGCFNHSSEAQRLPASPSEATPSTRHRDRRQRVINFRAGPSAHSAIEAPPARRTTTTRTASPQGPGASPPRDGRTMRSACANGERSNAASSNSIARLVLYACIRKRPVDHPFTRYLQIPPDDTKGSSARASNWTHSSLGNQHRKQRFSTPQLRRLRPRARSRTPSGAPSRRRAALTRPEDCRDASRVHAGTASTTRGRTCGGLPP